MAHNNNNFVGAGHQYASVWDNGDNLVDQLKTEIEVRRIGLANFSPTLIREGEPYSELRVCAVATVYAHRFQLNSAAQSLGGADYRNGSAETDKRHLPIIDGEEQRDAIGLCSLHARRQFPETAAIWRACPLPPIAITRAKRFPEEADCYSTPWGG